MTASTSRPWWRPRSTPYAKAASCASRPLTSSPKARTGAHTSARRGSGRPSVEMAGEKLVQAATCVVRCLAVVLQPMTERLHAGLEVRVIETMVRAGMDNELDGRAVVAPAGDLLGAVRRRRPFVESPGQDERGDRGTCHGLLAGWIERRRRPERKVAGRDERLERVGLCHRESHPGAGREADRSHTLWIDEWLGAQEE